MSSKRGEHVLTYEERMELAKTISDLNDIHGEIGSFVKVIQWSDTAGRPGRSSVDEFYGLITEDHPRWIRVLRYGAIGNYFTTILKTDLLTGKTHYHIV